MSQILRKDVPEEETWNLADIYASESEWETALAAINKEVDTWLEAPIALADAAEVLKNLQKFDRLLEDADSISSYAMYRFSEDSTDPDNQRMMGRSQLALGKLKNLKTNFINTLLQIPQEEMARFIKEEQALEAFRPFLKRIEETRKHALPVELEELLASLTPTLNAAESNFHTVTASDLKFEPAKDQFGNERPVSLHMYMTQVETSPDTVLRRNAYQSLTNGLQAYQHGLAQALATEINKNVTLAKLRGYPSALDMLLQDATPLNGFFATDGMTTEYFEEILDTFRLELSPHMQRYARLRKKQLGLDKLLFSDVKAPLDPEFDPPITYEEAGEIIVAAVGVLGPEYQTEMQRVFDERWVYRADNVGRRMIPFGGGVHGVHGYSFYPWGGNMFDVLLLGHELGHALHFTLSGQTQKIINNSQSLLFVESPSTLVEHLIVDYLRENKEDPRLHRWLNMYLMMSYHHNCVTHVLEAELLRRLYKWADDNNPITTTVISNMKGEILSEFWGDTVEIDEGAKLTWMRQPHYYMGVYPFTYSVGMSASTVMAQRIKEEGTAVGEQWTNVLKQGGSKNGFELYEMVDLDMSTTANLKKAVQYVGSIVDELEKSFD